MVRVMAVAMHRSSGPPKPPLWRRRWFRRVLIGIGGLTLLGVLVVGAAALWAFTILPRSLPSVTALETLQPIQGTKIYDDNDEAITELHVERRILVPLSQIPQSLRDAILATEDRRFYSHWGIDPIGVARAIVQNYRRGRIVEGGSTITQQLTKVLFLTPDKSLERKLKEAVLALELERRYSKDRILEMYLNQVYFGQGSYGVEAAARTYFGKGVSELTVRESALIAGLPRAPTNYSPFDRPEAAKRRREVVLRRLVEFGSIKDEEAKRLAKTDLGLIPPERRRTTGQYFIDYVQQTLEAKYGPDLVLKGGLNVYTTLNPTMQLTAEQSLREGLKALAGRSAQTTTGARPGRVSRGRGGHGRAANRLREGDGRRLRFLPQRVQSGRAGQAPDRAPRSSPSSISPRSRPGSPPPRRSRTHRCPFRSAARTDRSGSPKTTIASSAARPRSSRRSKSPSTS